MYTHNCKGPCDCKIPEYTITSGTITAKEIREFKVEIRDFKTIDDMIKLYSERKGQSVDGEQTDKTNEKRNEE